MDISNSPGAKHSPLEYMIWGSAPMLASGFPCWIRATEGTGGLGSLRLDNLDSYKSWLFINSKIEEFTVSEFLTGRHLANQIAVRKTNEALKEVGAL